MHFGLIITLTKLCIKRSALQTQEFEYTFKYFENKTQKIRRKFRKMIIKLECDYLKTHQAYSLSISNDGRPIDLKKYSIEFVSGDEVSFVKKAYICL